MPVQSGMHILMARSPQPMQAQSYRSQAVGVGIQPAHLLGSPGSALSAHRGAPIIHTAAKSKHSIVGKAHTEGAPVMEPRARPPQRRSIELPMPNPPAQLPTGVLTIISLSAADRARNKSLAPVGKTVVPGHQDIKGNCAMAAKSPHLCMHSSHAHEQRAVCTGSPQPPEAHADNTGARTDHFIAGTAAQAVRHASCLDLPGLPPAPSCPSSPRPAAAAILSPARQQPF